MVLCVVECECADGELPPRKEPHFFRCMTTCGSRVSFFSAGFFWLFRVRSSWGRQARGRYPAWGHGGPGAFIVAGRTSAASFILLIMALTTSSASLMKVPPSRCRRFLLFMAFLRANMTSKSDMKLVLQTGSTAIASSSRSEATSTRTFCTMKYQIKDLGFCFYR